MLLTPTCTALRFLIILCEKYAESYKLRFNPDKCTLLIYADKNTDFYINNCHIMLCGKQIINVKTEKHLGHVFTTGNHSHLVNIDSVTFQPNAHSHLVDVISSIRKPKHLGSNINSNIVFYCIVLLYFRLKSSQTQMSNSFI